MPPLRTSQPYREPAEHERAFLRIITAGQPELARQIEACRVADYDVTGWWDVDVVSGPPAPRWMIDGPAITAAGEDALDVDVIRADAAPTTFLIGATGVENITPSEPPADPHVYRVEIIFWTDDAGMLSTIEVVSYGDGCVADPFRLFTETARRSPAALIYPANPVPLEEC